MSTAHLAWTAANDNVAVDHYNIYRRVDNGQWGAPPVPIGTSVTTDYDDTTVTTGHLYEYVVTALDAAGNESFYSNNGFANTNPGSDLTSAPLNLHVVTAGTTATAIQIAWDPPSSIPVSVIAYVVERDGVVVATNTANDFDYVDSGLPPQASHAYKVYARSPTDGLSPASATLNASSLADTIAPSAPAFRSIAAPTPTSVVVDWDASTDNVGVTQYVIARRTGTGPFYLAAVTTHPVTIWTDNGAAGNTNYTYQVAALDAANNASTITTTPSITTPAVPVAPNVYNVPLSIDRTGTTDVTIAFRNWLATVPDGLSPTNPNIIVFPTTNGINSGPATYRSEAISFISGRANLTIKGNGARTISKSYGFGAEGLVNDSWYAGAGRAWPRKRCHIAVRNSSWIRIQDFTVLGSNFPGNPNRAQTQLSEQDAGGHQLPSQFPCTRTFMSTVNASQTTIDVNGGGFVGQPWKGFGFSSSFGFPYYLFIGDVQGDAAMEVVRVFAETAISGGTRLTVERGHSAAWCGPGKAWPAGTVIRIGKVGGGAGTGAFDSSVEGQHAFELTRSSNCSLDNCTASWNYGDCFRISEDSSTTAIVNCHGHNNGRQGFTPDACLGLTVTDCDLTDIGRSYVDIEPAGDQWRVRDVIFNRLRCLGGATGVWVGMGGRGRGPTIDGSGRPNIDNIQFIDCTTSMRASVRGDLPHNNNGPTVTDGPRGKHVFLRCSGALMWGSPIQLITLYRCQGVTIKGHANAIATTQNTQPVCLNAHCLAYNSSGALVEALTANNVVNPACQTNNGGSIGRRANQVVNTDNNFPGASADWAGNLAGY